MTLWWLKEGWADTCCSCCGVNIKKSGGDPDWGMCYECFTEQLDYEKEQMRQYELAMEQEYLESMHAIEEEEHLNRLEELIAADAEENKDDAGE